MCPVLLVLTASHYPQTARGGHHYPVTNAHTYSVLVGTLNDIMHYLAPTPKTDAVVDERTSNVIRQASGSKRGEEQVQVWWE